MREVSGARAPRVNDRNLRLALIDLDAVLELPALAKLDVVNVASSSAWQAVLAELASRGVAVRRA